MQTEQDQMLTSDTFALKILKILYFQKNHFHIDFKSQSVRLVLFHRTQIPAFAKNNVYVH